MKGQIHTVYYRDPGPENVGLLQPLDFPQKPREKRFKELFDTLAANMQLESADSRLPGVIFGHISAQPTIKELESPNGQIVVREKDFTIHGIQLKKYR